MVWAVPCPGVAGLQVAVCVPTLPITAVPASATTALTPLHQRTPRRCFKPTCSVSSDLWPACLPGSGMRPCCPAAAARPQNNKTSAKRAPFRKAARERER